MLAACALLGALLAGCIAPPNDTPSEDTGTAPAQENAGVTPAATAVEEESPPVQEEGSADAATATEEPEPTPPPADDEAAENGDDGEAGEPGEGGEGGQGCSGTTVNLGDGCKNGEEGDP